jgi:hypothetical protein
MSEEYVRAGFVGGPLQAEIFKNLLASLGIDCILLREGASVVYGIVSGPLADIEVLVPVSRREEAVKLLEEFNLGELSATPEAEAAEEEEAESEEFAQDDEEDLSAAA